MLHSPHACFAAGLLALSATTTLACGGIAIVDPDSGVGGGSTMQSSSVDTGSTSTTMDSASVSVAVASSSSGATADCIASCERLFDCTQEDDLCPGLKGVDETVENAFKAQCVANPQCGLAAGIILGGGDCKFVIETLSGASAEFKNLCQGSP